MNYEDLTIAVLKGTPAVIEYCGTRKTFDATETTAINNFFENNLKEVLKHCTTNKIPCHALDEYLNPMMRLEHSAPRTVQMIGQITLFRHIYRTALGLVTNPTKELQAYLNARLLKTKD